MSSRLLSRNSNYIESQRNYSCDYSQGESKSINMTISGKFLSKYKSFKVDCSLLDSYPQMDEIASLESFIKKNENTDLNIIIGSGANGIIQNLVKLLFGKNKGNLVTPYYSFGQAEYAVTSYGSTTRRVYNDNYKIDFHKMLLSVDKSTRMVYICNPNNPTGLYASNKDIINFAKLINIPLVVDESGIEFTGKKSLLHERLLPENIIVIRSFSKAYGLSNLRVGYLACSNDFADIYRLNNTINECSGLSCSIIYKVIRKMLKRVNKSIKNVLKQREYLVIELKKLNIDVVNSSSDIIMTKTTFSDDFIDCLANNDISIIVVENELEKKHMRIAVQEKSQNKKFIKKLSDCISERGGVL